MAILPENPMRFPLLFEAKLAEKAGRCEEMVDLMEKLVVLTAAAHDQLTASERRLLSVAFKNRLDSLRSINGGVKKSDHDRTQLASVCARMLKLLDTILIPLAIPESESKIIYMRMKGDYHRYVAEIKDGDERKEASDEALLAYTIADHIGRGTLAPTHPLRLGVILNFAVFYYQIVDSPVTACNMAIQALEDVHELEAAASGKLDDEDVNVIVQVLLDNFSIWSLTG